MMIKHGILIIVVSSLILSGCSGTSAPSIEHLSSPAASDSHLPRLVSDSEGNVFMSWVEAAPPDDNMAVLKYARLEDNEWSSPRTVTYGDNWFVNWADFPSVTAVSGQPRAAHWLQKVPGNTYSYHVKVSVSDDQENWSPSLSPHLDNTATEHGFVSMIPWNDDATLAIWLDGRQTEHRNEGEYFDLEKAMTLRSALISGDGEISASKLIDTTVCDCCQTALVKTPEGALAAYRNRAEGEIRDIFISRYKNGEWTTPTAINDDGWKIGACPVNGPALAISNSVAVVAWFTGAGDQRRVKAAISTDAGNTFSSPVTVSEQSPLGRVDASVSGNGTVYVSWMERGSGDDEAELRVQAISRDGNKIAGEMVTTMNASRKSGFPQMEMQGDRLIFAWTDVEDTPEIKVAALPAAFTEID